MVVTQTDPAILEFGSRAGSWFALGLFAAVFGILGLVLNRQVQRRSPALSRWVARWFGLVLFLGPLSLIYATSLGGFYEAEVAGRLLRLHYLFGTTSEVPFDRILEIKAAPWYRGRWRLQVLDSSGSRYESATWNRESVAHSTAVLRRALKKTN